MKVMLTKDVYKLGRAGEVKKVADGYGRNFLLPQGLAVLASVGALKQAEKIKSQAEIRRTAQNSELKGLADQIDRLIGFAEADRHTGVGVACRLHDGLEAERPVGCVTGHT